MRFELYPDDKAFVLHRPGAQITLYFLNDWTWLALVFGPHEFIDFYENCSDEDFTRVACKEQEEQNFRA